MLKFRKQIPSLARKEEKKMQKVQENTESKEDASNINAFGVQSCAVKGYSNRMKILKNI